MTRIGILHPGEMGISVAASVRNSGHPVYWASEGRSADTRARADKYGLLDALTLKNLCAECSIIVSVCPPDAAENLALDVAAAGFAGLYVDANAISPQRAQRIGEMLARAGIAFVDGGIIGGPAWKPASTWLYLAGARAEEIAACFAAGPLETRVLSSRIGDASALKMCYAAYNKGTNALLAAIIATAENLGVRDALYAHWSQDDANFVANAEQRVRRSTAKAWRWVGEMEEIAATLDDAGMPGELHTAAAEIFRRLAPFKDARAMPTMAEVLAALGKSENRASDE
ncbi:MAG: DUF1932 domain-containing protein [Chloroflexi bacterium]|nr:DUF1932 domain-containing protein [Chloroflexota bacterium]